MGIVPGTFLNIVSSSFSTEESLLLHKFIAISQSKNKLETNVKGAPLHTVWSDCSLVFLVLQRPQGPKGISHRRFDKSILGDPERTVEVERAINDFFLTNDVEDVSPDTLWAAHKATIRGEFIQISSKIHRARMADIDWLEEEILTVGKQPKRDPKSTSTAKLALKLVLTSKGEKSLRWSGARFLSAETEWARYWQLA